MIANLRRTHALPMQAPIRTRPGSVSGIRDVAAEPAGGGDELAVKLSMLEAEVLALRHILAEVTANRDGLRKVMKK